MTTTLTHTNRLALYAGSPELKRKATIDHLDEELVELGLVFVINDPYHGMLIHFTESGYAALEDHTAEVERLILKGIYKS